jgi:hypothetical protein
VYSGFDLYELYDVAKEPQELRNVRQNLTFEQTRNELVQKVWRFAER